MAKKYFPGANTGRGFISHFSGIVPVFEDRHYTYILKGGPGVGKSTLMRKSAERAASLGYTVEEFRCASDPDSLDAIRIVEKRTVLLDGTAPHNLDPIMPGVRDEICNLGYFKNKKEFNERHDELQKHFEDNESSYRTAFACLKAASLLKSEALEAVCAILDKDKAAKYLSSVIGCTKRGEKRELFAKSATPDGVVDFSKTFLRDSTLWLSGIVGEAVMLEAQKLLQGRCHTVCYDFLLPTLPCTLDTGERSIAIEKSGDDMTEFLKETVPHKALFCMAEAERIVDCANSSLAGARKAHDSIEEIYRNYVDYERVCEEGEKLIKTILI